MDQHPLNCVILDIFHDGENDDNDDNYEADGDDGDDDEGDDDNCEFKQHMSCFGNGGDKSTIIYFNQDRIQAIIILGILTNSTTHIFSKSITMAQ